MDFRQDCSCSLCLMNKDTSGQSITLHRFKKLHLVAFDKKYLQWMQKSVTPSQSTF